MTLAFNKYYRAEDNRTRLTAKVRQAGSVGTEVYGQLALLDGALQKLAAQAHTDIDSGRIKDTEFASSRYQDKLRKLGAVIAKQPLPKSAKKDLYAGFNKLQTEFVQHVNKYQTKVVTDKKMELYAKTFQSVVEKVKANPDKFKEQREFLGRYSSTLSLELGNRGADVSKEIERAHRAVESAYIEGRSNKDPNVLYKELNDGTSDIQFRDRLTQYKRHALIGAKAQFDNLATSNPETAAQQLLTSPEYKDLPPATIRKFESTLKTETKKRSDLDRDVLKRSYIDQTKAGLSTGAISFNPTDKIHAESLGELYKEFKDPLIRGGQISQGATQEIAQHMRSFVNSYRAIPDEMQKDIQGGLTFARAKDRVLWANITENLLQDPRTEGITRNTFAAKDLAKAEYINQMWRANTPLDRIDAKLAATWDKDPNLQAELGDIKIKAVDNVRDLFVGFTGLLMPEKTIGNIGPASRLYENTFKYEYSRSGNEDLARKVAAHEVKNFFQPSTVNGAPQLFPKDSQVFKSDFTRQQYQFIVELNKSKRLGDTPGAPTELDYTPWTSKQPLGTDRPTFENQVASEKKAQTLDYQAIEQEYVRTGKYPAVKPKLAYRDRLVDPKVSETGVFMDETGTPLYHPSGQPVQIQTSNIPTMTQVQGMRRHLEYQAADRALRVAANSQDHLISKFLKERFPEAY